MSAYISGFPEPLDRMRQHAYQSNFNAIGRADDGILASGVFRVKFNAQGCDHQSLHGELPSYTGNDDVTVVRRYGTVEHKQVTRIDADINH